MRKTSLLLFFAGLLLTASGCTAGTEDEVVAPTSEDEVRTAKCPTSFALAFEKPALLWSTMTRSTQYSSAQKSDLFSDMREARARKAFTATFTLTGKESGRCNYSASGIPNTGGSVRFETKAGKDQLQIDAGAIRYYITISSYDPSGLKVDGRTRGAVYGSVHVPRSEMSDLVRVGSVTAKAVDAPPASGDLVSMAGDLQSIIDPGGHARSFDATNLSGSSDMDLLKSFVEKSNEGDTEILAEYVWEQNASTYTTDETKAGLLSASEAKAMLLDSIEYWYESWEGEEIDGAVFSLADMKANATAKFDAIAASGAVFAYDGFWQHGCAAPTPFLIVIDKNAKAAFGLDLNPCTES